jgi:uridine kinase
LTLQKDLKKKKENVLLRVNGTAVEAPLGVPLAELAGSVCQEAALPVLAARYNNEMVDLSEPVREEGSIEFLDQRTEDGMRVYRQSLVFLLARAAYELFPGSRVVIKHSLGKSYYCELKGRKPPLLVELAALEARMREMVAADEPVWPQMMSKEEASQKLLAFDREDTVELLENMPWKKVKVYSCGRYASYSSTVLASRTGSIGVFKLEPYERGFVLRFPDTGNPEQVAPKYNLSKLAQVWQESEEWAAILGVRNLAGLLRLLKEDSGEANTLVHVGEALQEKKIARIADEIYARRDKARIVLIAGPSSSGKTTFAQRLAIQLRVLGLRPVYISTDDYFVERELTPLDEYGEYDFEALEAVDLALFNEHLQRLMDCQEVECPVYNFQLGSRERKGRLLKVEEGSPIIIEGIHALNETLTSSVRRENKYKIYISALTQVSIDDHNRIHTTDTRLIRRIVRDSRFRSQDALWTLKYWPSVRRGEDKNIFPFQEDADMMFNSALVFELGVLKKYAYPLLKAIDRGEKEYSDARRLLDLLDYFPEIPDSIVPLNSILREFIGGSSIHGK